MRNMARLCLRSRRTPRTMKRSVSRRHRFQTFATTRRFWRHAAAYVSSRDRSCAATSNQGVAASRTAAGARPSFASMTGSIVRSKSQKTHRSVVRARSCVNVAKRRYSVVSFRRRSPDSAASTGCGDVA